MPLDTFEKENIGKRRVKEDIKVKKKAIKQIKRK